MLYLLGMGIGVGSLVDERAGSAAQLSIRIGFSELIGDVEYGGRVVDYATFVAPALMASSAMNGAVFDSTMNVFSR